MKQDPLKDYLVTPFNDLVDKLEKNPVFNKCNIATGVTGQGKTYAVTSNHIEKLLVDKDQQIVIYSVPLSEIREDDKFDTCADDLMKKHGVDVKFTSFPKIALKYLKQGKKVVFCTNHQGIWTKISKYGKELFDYIYSKNLNPLGLKVGSYTDWISYSDHSPLIAELG